MRAYSPLKQQDQEETASQSGCGCFKLSCFDWQHNKDGQTRSLLQEGNEESWLVKKLKKLREVSEVIAGPKWKNMVRKIGKFFDTKKSKCRFKYDPDSYKLNFDHGVGYEEEKDGNNLIGFSSRFAPPVYSDHQKIRSTSL